MRSFSSVSISPCIQLSLTLCTNCVQSKVDRMKLPSGNEVEVLRLLAPGRELYGLEMIKRSEGALKRNSIYVVLGRMEHQGFIKGREVKKDGTPGMPRRLY